MVGCAPAAAGLPLMRGPAAIVAAMMPVSDRMGLEIVDSRVWVQWQGAGSQRRRVRLRGAPHQRCTCSQPVRGDPVAELVCAAVLGLGYGAGQSVRPQGGSDQRWTNRRRVAELCQRRRGRRGSGASPACESGVVFEVDPERFEQMVSDALDSLPAEFGGRVDNVAFVVDDGTPESPLLGLYEGIPLTNRSIGYSGVMPDRITIFRLPICARCTTEVEVREQVRRTVVHEVGHYFGIGDIRLRELGW